MTTFLSNIWSHGDRVALIDHLGQEITYNNLKNRTHNFQSLLRTFPSMAIMVCRNTVNGIVGYLSFVEMGVVPLLLPSKLPLEKIKRYISVYSPVYLYLDFYFDHKFYSVIKISDDYWLYISKSVNSEIEINESLRVLLTTSGSTGNPKLVRLSDNNLIINNKMIHKSLPMEADDVALTTLPFSYSYGLSIINSHLLLGSAIQLNEFSVVQRNFWNLLYESRSTFFGGVPFTYEQIQGIGFEKILPSSIRYLTQAGGKLPQNILEKIRNVCQKAGIDFYVMYGQTEATARMSVLAPSDAKKHPRSIGKAIPPGRFSLSAPHAESEILDNEIGELTYHGGNVALGYAESIHDLKRGDDWGGTLKTGDLAYISRDGFVFHVGRLSRFIKIRGLRYSLDDIEIILSKIGLNVTAIELNDKLSLISTQICSQSVAAKELRKSLRLLSTDFQIIQVHSIPRLPTGKVDFQYLIQSLNTKTLEP